MYRKKRLLQILYPGLGGHSSVAFSLIEGDITNEFEHHILGYGIEDISNNILIKAKSLGVETHSVKKASGLDLASLKNIYHHLKEIKPDTIICHSTAVIFIVWWYCFLKRKKFISVEHQSNSAKTKKDWLYTFIICFLSPKIVYLTDIYKSQIKSKFGAFFPKNKITIIPNGINTSKFLPVSKQTNDHIVISMISRMNVLRDHKTLIRAFSQTSKDFNLQLVIAGDGNTKAELELYVCNNFIKNVTFVGNLDEEQVIELIHKTDIYVHSSLAETMSTTLLQVMACKVPIIATNIAGINNLLENDFDAMLFPPGDWEILTQMLTKLIENRELTIKLSNNAYSKLIDNYSCNGMFSEYKKNIIII